jgi:hypothetical protein
MKITIFGCCRQDSLYRLYDVSSIRDNLTYPHYSSEALQAMRFCAGEIEEKNITNDYIFRSQVISKRRINYKKINREFKKTELFAIEIASRKYYKFKNYFLHHICEEPSYGCKFFDEVEVSDLSDQEIESDILSMKALVGPKKIFLITHFYTKTTGKRYELASALKKIGIAHGIPVFDPVEAIGGVENIIPYLVDEPVYTHYNTAGHRAIGKLYKEFVFKNFSAEPLWYRPYVYEIKTLFSAAYTQLKNTLIFFNRLLH